jgi:hypothetical protein
LVAAVLVAALVVTVLVVTVLAGVLMVVMAISPGESGGARVSRGARVS